ncbi:substrate-binding periplasmic protein [Roseateles violae]|uniref:Transporter substrate-binding domain-containing protein n=1 Tax=Roseateles violae TaxID=3058042 RepID=A0ABT8DYU0_9BURK|nr:transporter substrate-binding domain-containing protein [Pelomonas sp. PFR6]MDN3922761.1 transporter substrate-binding domain-containing protein [Pelomonas sp. PFR6]
MRTILIWLVWLCPAFAAADSWDIYTHSLGGQVSMVGGELRGREHAGKRAYYLELVRRLRSELGIDGFIHEVPFARGLQTVQRHPGVVFFNLNRTPEREDTVQWVGPISRESDYLFESAARPTQVRSLDDARALSVCVLKGNVHDEFLSRAGFTQLTRTGSYSACLRMLAAGRVQLIAAATSPGMVQRLNEAGLPDASVVRTPVMLTTTVGYIALSRQTPADEVSRWQQALDRLKQSGELSAMTRRYEE